MDFGTLLHVAKKNSENVQNSNKFYSTKFAPPKKESKVEKKLSDNIKKFLEKKEKEEREKAKADKEKLDNLLAMRDEKSKNKIKKMLKVTKSANRSVLDDVDPSASAVIEDGLIQPDEDDYGYVSNTAAELFKKYVDKVGQLPEEKKFSASRPATIKDLSSTKDRVKAAIMKEQEEKSGKSRSGTNINSSSIISSTGSSGSKSNSVTIPNGDVIRKSRKDIYDPQAEKEAEEQRRKEESAKKTKSKANRPAPPPIDFQDLLKLAEKKQFEPVEIKVDETKKEPERLLTKKEKQEWEERRKYLEEKEKRKKSSEDSASANNSMPKFSKSNINNQDKKPQKELQQKLNAKPKSLNKSEVNGQRDNKESVAKSSKDIKLPPNTSKTQLNNNGSRSNCSTASSSFSSSKNGIKSTIDNSTYKSGSNISLPNNVKSTYNPGKELPSKDKKVPIKDIKTREFPPKDIQKVRDFPPKDIQKTRQFPPSDVKRPKPEKKPIKRRILDDDEYDSEMDDFIDDGPEESYGGGYSKYIKEIFGYDKSRYRDEDFDDDRMESNFAQQMREETISRKIGLMEDLEDMKKEAEEKKRKFEKMKKMRHK